jgi:DeoR family glycerol-3-phosphate regulon repressor
MKAFNRDGFVSVSDIAREIGVSPMTIRRDLALLDRDGQIVRTHGGGVVSDFDSHEPVFDQRLEIRADEKSAIARAAAGLIMPMESVGLDVGTSILALADQIKGRNNLRIFTNNLRAAMALAGSGSPVYIAGGEVRTPEFSIVGTAAIEHLKKHYLDRAFIGVSGLCELGIFDFSPEDTEVKRAFIEISDCVVVVCDSSKFGRRGVAHVGALDAIDILVTDQPPPPDLAKALVDAGVQVIVAQAGN